jgi:hypothetical protein
MNENQNLGEKQGPPTPTNIGSAFDKAMAELKAGHDLPDLQPTTMPPVEPSKPPLVRRWRIDWGSWLCVLALVGVGAWYLHGHLAKVREQHVTEFRQQIRQQQTHASIAALALKYNAVTNWSAALPDRRIGEAFSIDVSRALIRSNGQPVLIIMNLEDVAENNGGYTALFGKDDIKKGMFQLSVELRCTQERANQLLKTTDNDFFQTYAVVARFDEVARPKFRVSGIGGGEDSSVELDNSSDVFLVKGELLDAVQLP